MLPTRPCLYCLSLNGGCVFADFDLNGDRLYIVRISFDGFGCYKIADPNWAISAPESKLMMNWIDSNDVDHDDMRSILTDYIQRRKTAEFDDALAYNEMPH